jgi:peptidoglycan/LPS O-acetylase OafA/YrhL
MRTDIQALRGVAVLAVLLFHAEQTYFPLGYFGVDIFFVISGFVVTPLILRIFETPSAGRLHSSGLKQFYIKRFYRLAPALASTVIITTPLIFLFGPINDHQGFARQGVAALLLIGNLGAFNNSPNYFSPAPNPLLHTWSLSVEAQIYILFPLALVILAGARRNVKSLILLSLIATTVFGFLTFWYPNVLQPLYSLVGIESAREFSFYSSVCRIWQFSAGGLLFLFSQRANARKAQDSHPIIQLLALFSLIFVFVALDVSAKMGSCIFTLLAIALIYSRSLDILPKSINLVLRWLGDRSYSIYLVHLPVIYLAKFSPLFSFDSNGSRAGQTFIAILITLLLGSISYSRIEQRFRVGRVPITNAPLQSIRKTAITLVVLLSILLGLDFTSGQGTFKDPRLPPKKENVSWDWDPNCTIMKEVFTEDSHPCVYQSPGSNKNYLLIGDSHASTFSEAFVSLAKNDSANLYVFTYAGCPFILDAFGLEEKASYPYFSNDCFRHNAKILNFLDKVQVDTIIYTQRSNSSYIVPQSERFRTKVNQKIASELLKLHTSERKIIFLGITPEYIPVETVLQRFSKITGQYSIIPAQDDKYFKNFFSKKKIQYIELYSSFCAKSRKCMNWMDGNWLFEDNDHLSQSGVQFVMPVIQNELERRLPAHSSSANGV